MGRHPAPGWSNPVVVHADLAPLAALALSDQDRAAASVEVGFGQGHRLADPQSRPPEHDEQPSQPQPVLCFARLAHDRDDLLDPRRVGRIAKASVARRTSGVEAGQCCGRATPAGRDDHVLADLPTPMAVLSCCSRGSGSTRSRATTQNCATTSKVCSRLSRTPTMPNPTRASKGAATTDGERARAARC